MGLESGLGLNSSDSDPDPSHISLT